MLTSFEVSPSEIDLVFQNILSRWGVRITHSSDGQNLKFKVSYYDPMLDVCGILSVRIEVIFKVIFPHTS